MKAPHYVLALSNEDLIDRVGQGLHPLQKRANSCYELAVLVHRLRATDPESVHQALDRIERLARVSMTSKLQGPMRCPKCIAKLFVFGAVIASTTFPERQRLFLQVAQLLISRAPSRSPSSLDTMEHEVAWYIRALESCPNAFENLP